MTCESARQLWGEYAAGSLPETDRGALDSHAVSCAACRRERDAYVRLESLLGLGLARPAPVGSLSSAIVRQIRAGRRPGLRRWAAAVAAASVLVSVSAVWLASQAARPTSHGVSPTVIGPAPVQLHQSCRDRVLPPVPGAGLAGARTTERLLRPSAPVSRRLIVVTDAPGHARVMSAARRLGESNASESGSSMVIVVLD